MTMELGEVVKARPIRNLPRLQFWDAFYAAQRQRNRVAA
jgi:hypothetical protein